MLKRYITYILLLLVALPLRAEDFDPVLPPDPAAAYTISLSASPVGVAELKGDGAFANNTMVTIECVPSVGYAFSHWTKNGQHFASTAQYTFSMPSENIVLVAHLVPLQKRQLSLSCNLPNAAILEGQGAYYKGEEVTVSCVPAIDYHFQHWTRNGEVYSTLPTFQLTMEDTNIQLVAVFTHTPHSTITIEPDDEDAGFVSSLGGRYLVGTTIDISATPRTNYVFSHWMLNGTRFSSQMDFSYTVRNQDDHFVAVFDYDPMCPNDPYMEFQTAIYIESNPVGAASFNIASGTKHPEGAELLIKAYLKEGYRIDGWYIGSTCVARTAEFIYVVGEQPQTLVLRATPIVYSQLTLQSMPKGAVSFNTSTNAVYEAGTNIALQAIAQPNYLFDGWYLGDSLLTKKTSLLYTVPSTAAVLTARATLVGDNEDDEEEWDPLPPDDPGMTEKAYIVVKSDNPTMGKATGTASYVLGDQITIQAIPNTGYIFTRWSDGSTQPKRVITVTEDATYTAYFTATTYRVTVRANNPMMGSVTGGGIYPYHSSATLTAVPADGYRFVRWSDNNTEPVHNIYVASDTTLIAYFSPIMFRIQVASSNNVSGYVIGGGMYNQGEVAVLTAVPNAGYRFIQWSDGELDNPRYVIVTQDETYTALFTAPIATSLENIIGQQSVQLYDVLGRRLDINQHISSGVYVLQLDGECRQIWIP